MDKNKPSYFFFFQPGFVKRRKKKIFEWGIHVFLGWSDYMRKADTCRVNPGCGSR